MALCSLFFQCDVFFHLTQPGCRVGRIKAKIWNTAIWRRNISLDNDVESFRRLDLMTMFWF